MSTHSLTERLLRQLRAGATLRESFDTVVGPGGFERVLREVVTEIDALRGLMPVPNAHGLTIGELTAADSVPPLAIAEAYPVRLHRTMLQPFNNARYLKSEPECPACGNLHRTMIQPFNNAPPSITTCGNCGAYYLMSEPECPACGELNSERDSSNTTTEDDLPGVLRD